MPRPEHLSWSQYNLFLKCQRQYCFRYVHGLKERPAGVMQVGTWGHEAIAADLIHKRDKGSQLTTPAFLWEWEKRYKAGIKTESGINWSGTVPGQIKDQMIGVKGTTAVTGKTRLKTEPQMGLLPLVHVSHLPKLTPELVEFEFKLPVPGTDLHVLGYIDYYGGNQVKDWKFTGSKMANQKGVDADDQTTLYAAALRAEGKKVAGVSLEYLQYGASGPKTKSFPMKRPVTQQKRILSEFRDFAGLLDKLGDDPVEWAPAPRVIGKQANWVCSASYCGYWHRCSRGGGKNTVD